MKRQTTLKTSSPWIEGMHLDQDALAGVRFHPASRDEGIVFSRSDLPGSPEVRCLPEHLQSMPRWTALEANGVWVHHTEHVLAALALCEVDNVRVEMNADRLPMTGGGTCAAFVAALQRGGITPQDAPRRVYALKAPVFYLDRENTEGQSFAVPPLKDGRYVLGVPAERFAVSTVFHWSHMPSLPIGVAEYETADLGPDESFVHARSYLVEGERDKVGDLLGPVRDEVMQLFPGCPVELAVEAARHKVVDFIGDLMILGRPVLGRFAAFRAGHRIHHELVRKMVAAENLVLTEAP